MPFTESIKDAAYMRSGGACECRREAHNHWGGRCLAPVFRHGFGHAEFNHIVSQFAGGADTIANCEVLCQECHFGTRSYGRH